MPGVSYERGAAFFAHFNEIVLARTMDRLFIVRKGRRCIGKERVGTRVAIKQPRVTAVRRGR